MANIAWFVLWMSNVWWFFNDFGPRIQDDSMWHVRQICNLQGLKLDPHVCSSWPKYFEALCLYLYTYLDNLKVHLYVFMLVFYVCIGFMYIVCICICYNWFHMCASCWLKSIFFCILKWLYCVPNIRWQKSRLQDQDDWLINLERWQVYPVSGPGRCYAAYVHISALICTYLHCFTYHYFYWDLFSLTSVFTGSCFLLCSWLLF